MSDVPTPAGEGAAKLPATECLELRLVGPVLYLTLSRPKKRNAMSVAMVDELVAVCRFVRETGVRAVVIRGAGGHFCAGGDVSDMAGALSAPLEGGPDPVAVMNRRFGSMLQAIQALPAAVIAVCEGAVMGGGFGLACVSDVAIAVEGARFRLPETGLGITPAQVMPFIVRRIGGSQARRLAVTGQTLDARSAAAIGLAHLRADDSTGSLELVEKTVAAVLRCEPAALAATKRLALRTAGPSLDTVLDAAAAEFAAFARSERAVAGMTAFLTRKPAPWVPQES